MGRKFPVIDGHYHTEKMINKDGGHYLDHLEEYLKCTGVAGLNVAALATTEWDVGLNMLGMLAKEKFDNVFVHGALGYEQFPVTGAGEGFDPLTQYRELMAMGCDGVARRVSPTPNAPVWPLLKAYLQKYGHLVRDGETIDYIIKKCSDL